MKTTHRTRLPLSALALCLTGLMLLSACGGGSGGHTHAPEAGWACSTAQHWHVCACGETFDAADHTLEDETCTVCGCSIYEFDDGTQLYAYNEQGDCVLALFCGPDGNVLSEERTEYTYDADGNATLRVIWTDGALSSRFEAGGKDDAFAARDTYYYEDGTQSVSEHDAAGMLLRSTWYAADGTVESELRCSYDEGYTRMTEQEYAGETLTAERHYALDEDYVQTTLWEIYYDEDGAWSRNEYDPQGEQTLEGYYDAAGNALLERRYEHTYDDAGNKLRTRTWEDGVLTEETDYVFGSDDEGSWSMSYKTTKFHADGSKTVSEMDPENAWSTQTEYDAAGNVTHSARNEYTHNEDGELIHVKFFEDERLTKERDITLGPDGNAKTITDTEYHADGSKTVSEYDGDMDLLQETTYDPSGNKVS